MAGFSFNGVDYLSATFEELSQLTDDDKLSIIMPAAELLAEKHSAKIRQVFNQRSGTLADSITVTTKTDDDGVYAHVSPKGKHPKSSRGKRMKNTPRGRRSSGKYSGSNAEIGFILNYGSPRIPASHWMENANEEAEAEIEEAEQNAWNDLMEKKGL